ncbi:hypothetical protein CHUAL_014172 [Chamberlinius hualienensis]
MAEKKECEKFHSFKSGEKLRRQTKQIIVNVHYQLSKEAHRFPNELLNRAAHLTGVSSRTVQRLKSSSKLESPKPIQLKTLRANNRLVKYDELELHAIRSKVHSFFHRNEIPTGKKVLNAVNEDPDLPSFALRTFYKVLHDIGFTYTERKRQNIMTEQAEIILCRRRYLRSIQTYREAAAKVYYIDEMLVHSGQKQSKAAAGSKLQSGKDEWLILVNAGSESGFVPGASLHFRSKKMSDDHEEMNGERFLRWFQEQFLPNIEPKSIIVMDNASYHSVKVEKVPTADSRKTEIQDWLTVKRVPWKADMLKVELLALINSVKEKYNRYQIDIIAEAAGHTVLRLPPYHCDLNPLEMVWSQLKGLIGYNNAAFKLTNVENLVEKALAEVTPQMWANFTWRVMEIEERYWQLDNIVEEMAERISVNPDICSDDEDSDSDGEMAFGEFGEEMFHV